MQKFTKLFLLAALFAFVHIAPAHAQEAHAQEDVPELPKITEDSAAKKADENVWEEKNLVSPQVESESVEESSVDDDISSEEIGNMLDDLYGEDKEEKVPAVKVEKVAPAPKIEAKKQKKYRTQILPSKIYKKRYNPRNSHLPKARTLHDFDRYVFAAASTDNINGLRALLDMGRDPDAKNAGGNTPLMAAALTGSLNTSRLLLIKGADADIQNDLGLTALHIAASTGENRIVKTLVNAGANIDIQDKDGNTPLMSAALYGNLNAATSLVKAKANIDIQNSAGMTALHIASYKGHASVIQALLIADADPNIKDNNDAIPEELAVARGHRMAARVLQGAGPRRGARAYSKFLLGNIDNEDGNEKGWYEESAEKMRYALLPEREQEKWDNLLADWVDADAKFDLLSDGEKHEWNIKRKILQNVFREYFTADSAEGQAALDEYMGRWEGNIINTADEIEETAEKPEPSEAEKQEDEIDREKRKLLQELKKIENQIPSSDDYGDIEEEYNDKFDVEEEAKKLPEELPADEEKSDEEGEEYYDDESGEERPVIEDKEDVAPTPPEATTEKESGSDEEEIWEDQIEDNEELPEVKW